MGNSITDTTLTLFGFGLNLYGIFIIALFTFFIFIFWKAQKNKRLDWVDIITKDGKRVSLTKILQLVGGIVATWIVVQMTILGNMTWDVLAIYLTYVASIEGFSKFVQAKYNTNAQHNGNYRSYNDGFESDYDNNYRHSNQQFGSDFRTSNNYRRPSPRTYDEQPPDNVRDPE